jgi:PHS family inorganic phosphate transporter-like MFS transporter
MMEDSNSPDLINNDSQPLISSPPSSSSHSSPQISSRLKLIVASVGFFTDAYDLFVMNMVNAIFEALYKENYSPADKSLINSTALAGAVVGQLSFGIIGDLLGRTSAWIVTLSLIIIGDLGSALTPEMNPKSIAIWLAFFRFFLGLGIGGEYPLSATVSSEASKDLKKKARNTALVFSSQGWGNLFSPLLVLVLLNIFPNSFGSLHYVWRIAIGFSALPCMITFYFRYNIFKSQGSEELKKRERKRFSDTLSMIKMNWKVLLGTAGSWFIFDIVFYANALFSSTILSLLKLDSVSDSFTKVKNLSTESVYIALMGLPGYYVAVLLINKLPRRIQAKLGFAFLALIYFIMGIWFDRISAYPALFLILYGLTFFIANVGPNTTTFVVPTEVFSEEIRSTCHGISAASGKLGAVVGAAIMPFMQAHFGLAGVMICSGSIALVGLILSLMNLVPETLSQ